MKAFKRCVLILAMFATLLALSSCGESSDAKLKRLTEEAAQKKREAQQAQDDYNLLKTFVDNNH